jgi:hypothetical protein
MFLGSELNEWGTPSRFRLPQFLSVKHIINILLIEINNESSIDKLVLNVILYLIQHRHSKNLT